MRKKFLVRFLTGVMAASLPLAEMPVVFAEGEDAVGVEVEATEAAEPEADLLDGIEFTSEMIADGEEAALYDASYPILKDASGNVYDLGGIDVVIRDWWSSGFQPTNAYEYAKQDYWDWAQKTYHFTIKQMAISDWDSSVPDYRNYVNAGGDENNYLFLLPASFVGDLMHEGYLYDLSSIADLDLTKAKYSRNTVSKTLARYGNSFAMLTDWSEPRGGLYMNLKVLKDAGIDPNTIYDMQANGTWTWSAWTDIMDRVQRDTDGDGEIDIWGYGAAGNALEARLAIMSNGGAVVAMQNGNLTNGLNNVETTEALTFYQKLMDDYKKPLAYNQGWAQYRTDFMADQVAFVVDGAYMAAPYGEFTQSGSQYGYVIYPRGPRSSKYASFDDNNVVVIPACYDAERARKIALAYDIMTEDIPGYENYNAVLDIYAGGAFDQRALSETLPLIQKSIVPCYDDVLYGFDSNTYLYWNIYAGSNINQVINAASSVVDYWIGQIPVTGIYFVKQPDSYIVKSGDTVNFGVQVNRGYMSYSWETRLGEKGTWEKVPNGSGDSLSYTIGSKADCNGRYFRCVVENPVNGETYYSRSAKVSFAEEKLLAPTIDLSAKGKAVALSWNAVAGAKGYKVLRKEEGGAYKNIKTLTETSYTDTTAAYNVKYSYKVRAYNDKKSADSDEKSITLKLPVLTNFVAKKSGANVLVSWTNTPGVDGYYVYRKEGTGSYKKVTTVTGADKKSYTDKSVQSGKTYTYMARTYKGTTQSGNSAEVKVTLGALIDSTIPAPSFAVKGVLNGRNVTFNSTQAGSKVYYSSTTSNLTTSDKGVAAGGTVLFNRFYGTLYARTYYNGKWSNPARLILKIPVVNKPTITNNGGGYYTITTTTPSCAIIYTTDGSTPSLTNGKKVNASSSKVYVGTGKTVKAIAVRSCFTNSDMATGR